MHIRRRIPGICPSWASQRMNTGTLRSVHPAAGLLPAFPIGASYQEHTEKHKREVQTSRLMNDVEANLTTLAVAPGEDRCDVVQDIRRTRLVVSEVLDESLLDDINLLLSFIINHARHQVL